MIGVVTGDIIKSRRTEPGVWQNKLRETLSMFGRERSQWEIYRGDSFQLAASETQEVLKTAITIKASVKTITGLDVRLSIGLGEQDFYGNSISEAGGTAFVRSGEAIENLKKLKVNLAIKSEWQDFDEEMNLYLKLGLIAMDRWTAKSANTVLLMITNGDSSQTEMADKLGLEQSTISRRLKRAYYQEVLEINDMFVSKLRSKL